MELAIIYHINELAETGAELDLFQVKDVSEYYTLKEHGQPFYTTFKEYFDIWYDDDRDCCYCGIYIEEV